MKHSLIIGKIVGMLIKTHNLDFNCSFKRLKNMNYVLSYKILNAIDYLIAQNRKMVIFVEFYD